MKCDLDARLAVAGTAAMWRWSRSLSDRWILCKRILITQKMPQFYEEKLISELISGIPILGVHITNTRYDFL